MAEKFFAAEARHGSEAVWPYYYAGTMGLIMRDGINRLRHVKKYSGFHSTICVNPAWTGFIAGTGKLAGPDPREMARSDLVVIWGTNPVNTQVNVMTHAVRARKERGAKIVAVDIYQNGTMQQADLAVLVRPGTDGALACAVMHCLFRDGFADWDFWKNTPTRRASSKRMCARVRPHGRRASPAVRSRRSRRSPSSSPSASAPISASATGSPARATARTNMHAASCIAAVRGSWTLEGGGAFHNNGAIYHWNKTITEGHDAIDPSIRLLDQSRIGPILVGEPDALIKDVPVTALLIQNTNPVSVAPEQDKVKRGFARDDLFVCVHEQFMTETAQMADVVLPATMFMEHDDMYQGGGHQYIQLGLKLIDPPGECRSNHEVICALAKRLGARHEGFEMTPRQMIDRLLGDSGWGTLAELEEKRWIDCQPDFDTAHYTKGFAWPDGKFRFKPDWKTVPFRSPWLAGPVEDMPALPDHWEVIEEATPEHPFRLGTSPARNFLNSTFNETPTSLAREHRPTVMIHPEDAAAYGIADGAKVILGQYERRGAAARKAFRRRAARRADRGIDLAELGVRGRARDQYADGGGCHRAVRRGGIP